MILEPFGLFAMDSAFYASLYDLVGDECNMPCVCENASMNDNSHDCDAILPKSLDVVDIPNIKLLKEKAMLICGLNVCDNDSMSMFEGYPNNELLELLKTKKHAEIF